MSVSTTSTSQEPADVEKIGEIWIVQGVGSFLNKATYTFTGDTLPEGLQKSDYAVQGRERDLGEGRPRIPYNHRFDPENVQVLKGSLHLKVPGNQKPHRNHNNEISCAQIETNETNILYGSVRTKAMFSRVPGTCHGAMISFRAIWD